MTTFIKPTVGRVLHFFPTKQYMADRHLSFGDPSQPLAAVIAYVHSDTMVNLTVWDQDGLQFEVRSVPLVQGGDLIPGGSFFAAWMPYQKGQAAYAESLKGGDALSQRLDGIKDAEKSEALACAVNLLNVPAKSEVFSAIEQEIQAKGLTAPRITPADIEANIATEHLFTAGQALTALQHPVSDGLESLTICLLVLRNGTKIVGVNYGAIDPNQHSAEQGREEARAHAVEQVWQLMGYELRSRLHEASRTCTCGPNAGCTRCHVGMAASD